MTYTEESDQEYRAMKISSFAEGVRDEKQAWLEGRRCHICGGAMKPDPLTNTCPKCWEEE